VAEGIDELGGLLASFGDGFKSEFLDEIDEVAGGRFLGEDIGDLLSDLLNLSVLSVRALSDLSLLSSSEGDDEDSQNIAVESLDFSLDVNGGLPLSKIRAELISGHVQTVEVGQASSSLDFFNAELDFSPKIIRYNFIFYTRPIVQTYRSSQRERFQGLFP
jgi:hypothetical protein